MAEFFTGGPFSQGLNVVRNIGEIQASMKLKSQELEWSEKQGPAMQAKLAEIMEKVQAAADESDDAEPGSPQEMAAQGRYMVELSRSAPRVMALLSGLQLSGNPFAAQAGQQMAQSFLQMTQATMQGAAQLQAFSAQQQEMAHEQARETREQELHGGQLELQQGQLGLQQEQIAGARDERAVAREELDYKRGQRPLQEEALRAQIDESKAGAEQRRAEAEQARVGRPSTLGEQAQMLAAVTDAEAGGFLTPENARAWREKIGAPPGVESLQMWDQNLQAERKSLEAMLERTSDPRRKQRIQKRLEEIRKEDERLMDVKLDTDEKRRTGPRWYESILGLPGSPTRGSPTGDPMGDTTHMGRQAEGARGGRRGVEAPARGSSPELSDDEFAAEERRLFEEEVARRRERSRPVIVPMSEY